MSIDTVKINNQRIYDAGYDAGKQAEYDAFWDRYQDNGAKRNYQYTFAGIGWNDITFKPKYDIVIDGLYAGTGAFNLCRVTNLKEILKKCGVMLDTSKCGNFSQAFQNTYFTELPTIDLSNATNTNYALGTNAYLHTIDKIIVSEKTVFHINAFNGATALENVIFEGVIASNNLDLHWSKKLSKASIESIINCLSTETSGLTVTLSAEAVNNAFTDEEWAALEATKTNWTISLV